MTTVSKTLRRTSLRRLGVLSIAFFTAKGLLWLALAYATAVGFF